MVYAVLNEFRQRSPDGRIVILSCSNRVAGSSDGKRLACDFAGVEFDACWRGRSYLCRMYKCLVRYKATEVVVLGADCMDGYYVPGISLALLSIADLACRLGISTRITGFSFNEHPIVENVRSFRLISSRLRCNARDILSFQRLKSFCGSNLNAHLVADVAFNLQPKDSEVVESCRSWMNQQHSKGRIVLAFNLHGMLVGKDVYEGFVSQVAQELSQFLSKYQHVSIALVPHDYRPQGDLNSLARLKNLIQSDRVNLIDEVLSAAELKALMASVDGLFTSRMHLGIAALGQGKPICAFAYQGKFVGLFKHFSLPEEYVLCPRDVALLSKVLGNFIDDLPRLTKCVGNALPLVMALARKNFPEEMQQ